MRKTLTARTIAAIKPTGRIQEISDRLMPSLRLVVQVSGKRSWAVRYRLRGGKPCKYTIGSWPVISLEIARERATEVLRAVSEGRNPGAEKKESIRKAQEGDTVKDVADQFVKRHVSKLRQAKETTRMLRRFTTEFGHMRLDQVTRADIRGFVEDIAATSPVSANRTFAVVRQFFNYAIDRELIAASPCAQLKRPAEERTRDRILTNEELTTLWAVATAEGYPFGDIARLLILTGQRLQEIAGMRWDELKDDVLTIDASRMKNKAAHTVFLSKQALEIIESVPRIAGPYVFTATGARPVTGHARAKQRMVGKASYTYHDLRRTAVSGMAQIGIALHVIEKVVGHRGESFAGVRGIYNRHAYREEMCAALQRWADHVESLVRGDTADNIIRHRFT